MNESNIELHFDDNTVAMLAGYNFGEVTYNVQVKPYIDFTSDKICIKFPDDKSAIASSFIQGFFSQIKEEIGLKAMREKLVIESRYPRIKEKISKELGLWQ